MELRRDRCLTLTNKKFEFPLGQFLPLSLSLSPSHLLSSLFIYSALCHLNGPYVHYLLIPKGNQQFTPIWCFFFFLFPQASLLHWGFPGGSDGKKSNFLEKNVIACHQYWPLLDSEPERVGKLGRCSILDLRALVTLKTSYLFGWAACGILVPLLGIKPVLSALENGVQPLDPQQIPLLVTFSLLLYTIWHCWS